MLTAFKATATTSDVFPGTEQAGPNGILRIGNQGFSDIVQSSDDRIAGINRVDVDIELDPKSGQGTMSGRFVLTLRSGRGSWEGEMAGTIEAGLVSASGVARGTGILDGALQRIDFRQVKELPGPAPCDAPKAFFEMDGFILQRG